MSLLGLKGTVYCVDLGLIWMSRQFCLAIQKSVAVFLTHPVFTGYIKHFSFLNIVHKWYTSPTYSQN